MRRFLVIGFLLVIMASSQAGGLRPMASGSMGISLMGDNAYFNLGLGGVIPIKGGLCARFSVMQVRAGKSTSFYLGTGAGVGLAYYVPMRLVSPYGLFSMCLETEGNHTSIEFVFGGGAQMRLRGIPISPFGEMGFGFHSDLFNDSDLFDDYSDTDFLFNMLFGVRVEF